MLENCLDTLFQIVIPPQFAQKNWLSKPDTSLLSRLSLTKITDRHFFSVVNERCENHHVVKMFFLPFSNEKNQHISIIHKYQILLFQCYEWKYTMELMYKKLSSFLHTVTKFHFFVPKLWKFEFSRSKLGRSNNQFFPQKNRIFFPRKFKMWKIIFG